MGDAKKSGVDPWQVNEAFLRQQLEQGVKEIVFTEEDVNKIIQAYQNVPFDQILAYRYREVIWLTQNAQKFGYVRMGNRWIRRPWGGTARSYSIDSKRV